MLTNESILLLYCSKYFSHYLQLNQLLMPSPYSNNQEVDLFYSLLKREKKEHFGRHLNRNKGHLVEKLEMERAEEIVQDI